MSHCGEDIIGQLKNRKDSNLRLVSEANVTDIIEALTKLDKANKCPVILIDAFSLGSIPRSHPEELKIGRASCRERV